MSKMIFRWDTQSHFDSKSFVADDYQLKSNETFVAVPDGQNQPSTWTGSSWREATEEEHAAYLAEKAQNLGMPSPQEPSGQDTALAGLLKDVATIKTNSKSQDQLNSSIMKQLADQKVAQDKVNATVLKQLATLTTTNKQPVTQQ